MSDSDMESHYAVLVRTILAGRWVPVLGAGANRDVGEAWKRESGVLPLGSDLAGVLGELGAFEATHGLADSAQKYENRMGRTALEECTHEYLDLKVEPKPAIRFLAGLPRRLQAATVAHPMLRIRSPHLLIVTTNYDTVLEQALDDSGEPYDVVTFSRGPDGAGGFLHVRTGENGTPREIERPNHDVEVKPVDRSVILKLHGSIAKPPGDDEFVITENDYIDMLADDAVRRLPVGLAAKMNSSHLLFLGYGMKDWTLRVILRRMWGRRPLGFQSWAIQLDPSHDDIKEWVRRGVDIMGIDLREYIAGLDAKLERCLRESPPNGGPAS